MKSYAEIKQALDNLVNKMSMEELEILLEKAKQIKTLNKGVKYESKST